MDFRVKAAINIMHQSVAAQVSLSTLSSRVNLSATRFRQLFKKEFGLSPMQYIKCVRLERAADLLQTSFLSIKEVGFHAGLGDASHFVRDFKKRYGLTPGEFRAGNPRSSKGRIRIDKPCE